MTQQYSVSEPPAKTSLGFICSPISELTSLNTSRPLPVFHSESRRRSRHPAGLEALPREALALVAYHLVVDDQGIGRHPSCLLSLLLTARTIHQAISFENNPQLYNSLFRATFDHAALTRRYQWMKHHLADVAGRGTKMFDLFSDPRSWAIDYQTRWEQSTRMRIVAKLGSMEIPGLCDQKQMYTDLWNVWFLLTENDGKNMPFLVELCCFRPWLAVFYREEIVKESLVPGYPRENGEKALAIWCALITGQDQNKENTAAEVDEKIFVLRPYIFACAKYDVTYAPWHHRRLPLSDTGRKADEPDVMMRAKALPYKRFGYSWRRAPPHFIAACYLIFLRLLERQPGRMGLKPGSSTFSMPPGDASRPGLFSINRLLPSIYHDREWQRDTVCQDPHISPGLPAMTYRGELEGFWRGKFLFYDFEHYRQILAGNMRGVYTGTFAEQAAEMEFKETIIKVKIEDIGGKGPLLCAGFDEDDDATEEEQKRIQAGYGNQVVTGDEPDEPGWTKEILISGRCRTSWGWARIRGRIRPWDGLLILAITYSRHLMGRWLWRGYLHTGGYLVGRWRDTFTPENLRGYEGAFGMVRAGDIFYPSHFPTRMEDPLGIDRSSGISSHVNSPSYAPADLSSSARTPRSMEEMSQIKSQRCLFAETSRTGTAAHSHTNGNSLRVPGREDESWLGQRKWKESAVREERGGSRKPELNQG